MAMMTIRTTVAFDPATVARWERLSKRWGVSKSEALRRALERAEDLAMGLPEALGAASPSPPARQEIERMSPREALAWLRDHPLVTAEEGERWRQNLRQTREDFAARP